MTSAIDDAQDNYARILQQHDATHPGWNESNDGRKQRNRALAKPTAAVFKAIRSAQPKPEIDFQI